MIFMRALCSILVNGAQHVKGGVLHRSGVYNHGWFLFGRDGGVEAGEKVPHTGTLGSASRRPLDAVLRSLRGYEGLAEQGLLTGGLPLL